MKKLLALCFLLLAGSYKLPAQYATPEQAANATATIEWLRVRLPVREATGRNDGPEVAALVKAGGGTPSEHPEWCGFTQAADQRAHNLPIPGGGMQGAARAWFAASSPRTVYLAGRKGSAAAILPGYCLGFSYGAGIHHIGRAAIVVPPLRKGRPPRGFYSIAGNEGRGTNAGMHLTYYATPSIAAGANWLY